MPRSQFSRLSLCAAAIGALALAAFAIAPSRAAEEAVIIPAPAVDARDADGIQTAVIAGGCFWGVQGVFQHTACVVNAVSGYAGCTKATIDQRLWLKRPQDICKTLGAFGRHHARGIEPYQSHRAVIRE